MRESYMAGYDEIYTEPAGETLAAFLGDLDGTSFDGRAQSLQDIRTLLADNLDGYLEVLDACGIDHVVCPQLDLSTMRGTGGNYEAMADLQARSGGRILGLMGADPLKGDACMEMVRHGVGELGLKGVNINPFELDMSADDQRWYPIYELCAELDIPVVIHCSIHFARGISLYRDHPSHLEQVACDFPTLKIVANHAGWPWVLDLVAIAWRHPNVYISPAAQRPRYMVPEQSGWGPLFHYGRTLLRDRILWASGWPLQPFGRGVRELIDFDVADDVIERWCGANAMELLGLTEANASPASASAGAMEGGG